MDHCLLCGDRHCELSLYAAEPIVDVVRRRYLRGPLVYPMVVSWAAVGEVSVVCMNLIRFE